MRLPTCLLLPLACLPACERAGDRVVVYTSVDDVFSRPVLAAFEKETGIRVDAAFDAEAEKTTGLYHRLLAERARPRADVFWSSEVARTIQLERAGLLASFLPAAAAGIPLPLRSATGAWTGFGLRARVLVYNKDRVSEADRPRSIADLAAERFRAEAAVSDPLFGTMATHAGALRAVLGRDRMEEFFRALLRNEVKVVAGNSVVRDRVASGEVKIGLTDTDDANVALARGLRVGVVFPDQEATFPGLDRPLGTFVFPNSVALIAGAPHPEAGKKLVEFLLRPETEAALARSESAQIPVRPGIPRPTLLPLPGDLVTMEAPLGAVAQAVEESVGFFRDLLVR